MYVYIGIDSENISCHRPIFRERITILILPGEFNESICGHITPGIVESLYYVTRAWSETIHIDVVAFTRMAVDL